MLALEVLEVRGRADLVRRELDERAGRQVAPAWVADEDVGVAGTRAEEPGEGALGKSRLVPAVAGEDHVDVGRLVIEQVPGEDRHAPPVRRGVEPDGRGSVRIDIGGAGAGGAGDEGRDRAQPGS